VSLELSNVVKLQTSASVILIPLRIEEAFVNALQPSPVEEYLLSVCPGNEFFFKIGKKRVLKVAEVLPYAGCFLTENDIGGEDQGNLVKMGGVVVWSKQISISPCRC
jgi:hypothetical protein